MMETIRNFFSIHSIHADQFPFMMSVVNGATHARISMQRLIETAVTAAVLGALGYIAIIPRLEERITIEGRVVRDDIHALKEQIHEISEKRDRDYRDLVDRIDGRGKVK